MVRTKACDVEYWQTFDATILEVSREARLEGYRQVRDRLDQRIRQRFPADGRPIPPPTASAFWPLFS